MQQPTQPYPYPQQQYPQQTYNNNNNNNNDNNNDNNNNSSSNNNGMEVGGPSSQQLMNGTSKNGGPIITQTTTNKVQTSRKIQVPTANNTTTEIEETVVQYENVTVSTITQQNLQQHQQKYEKNDDSGNNRSNRSPTESEIIEGYTVPFSSQEQKQEVQNQIAPYQPQSSQTSTYNPPGTYGPYPVSYSPPSPNMNYSMPPSPNMTPQGSYVSSQRRSLEQKFPTSIQSNLPPEFFNKQQQLFNNLPPQIPITLPFDTSPQQLYLKFPPGTTTPSTSSPQQPYFPPGYVPADESDKKGNGKAKISKKFRIAN